MAGCGDEDSANGESRASSGPIGKAAGDFDPKQAMRDLRRQVAIGPRDSGSLGGRREVRLIKRRLRAAGMGRARLQKPWRNVVARVSGAEPGIVVVGAHHDTKDGIPGFVGANDGASGVAVLLEIARVLPRPFPGPSLVFAFFDAEEARGDRAFEKDGARGSKQFVRYALRGAGRQGSPRLDRIEAMYLLDMVGDCDLQIPREANSNPGLYRRLHGPPFGGTTAGILDDHIPFLKAGIPAVDVIDFTYGPGPTPGAWWHTPQDTLDKVCPASLGQAGRAVIRALGG
ncbi:MAG: M28 family metallopeptidase [Actinomycetota bacterium]